jgi:hypothetical protein
MSPPNRSDCDAGTSDEDEFIARAGKVAALDWAKPTESA